MIGPLALVRTLSSIKRSSKFCVEACSIMDSGVVNTMRREDDEDDVYRDLGGNHVFRFIHDLPVRAKDGTGVQQDKKNTTRRIILRPKPDNKNPDCTVLVGCSILLVLVLLWRLSRHGICVDC